MRCLSINRSCVSDLTREGWGIMVKEKAEKLQELEVMMDKIKETEFSKQNRVSHRWTPNPETAPTRQQEDKISIQRVEEGTTPHHCWGARRVHSCLERQFPQWWDPWQLGYMPGQSLLPRLPGQHRVEMTVKEDWRNLQHRWAGIGWRNGWFWGDCWD